MCVRRSLFIFSNISHTCSLVNLLLKGRKKKFNFTRVRHSTENATFPSNLCRTRLCRKWQQLSRLFYSYRRGDRVCRKKDTRARCLNCKGPLTNGAAAGAEMGEVEERVSAKSAHRFRQVTRKECYRNRVQRDQSDFSARVRSRCTMTRESRRYRLVESRLAT